jgi:hypothetical protein
MKLSVVVLAAAMLAAGCAHGKPQAGAQSQDQEDEARLAAVLAGRVAGPPQDCVSEFWLGSQVPYGRHAILFRGRTDDVVYVNRPPSVCPGLSYGSAIKVRTPMSRLCRGDLVTVFEPTSGMQLGGCSLGPFTPYRRAEPPNAR